jgi:predicted RNA binding protein YcfA (HicA-like mRNA interferase family)
LKFRDVIKLIEKDGWFLVRTRGSHNVYHHPSKAGNVIIAVHNAGRDVAVGTLKAILKQAGIQE